jgi:hypothetical protein
MEIGFLCLNSVGMLKRRDKFVAAIYTKDSYGVLLQFVKLQKKKHAFLETLKNSVLEVIKKLHSLLYTLLSPLYAVQKRFSPLQLTAIYTQKLYFSVKTARYSITRPKYESGLRSITHSFPGSNSLLSSYPAHVVRQLRHSAGSALRALRETLHSVAQQGHNGRLADVFFICKHPLYYYYIIGCYWTFSTRIFYFSSPPDVHTDTRIPYTGSHNQHSKHRSSSHRENSQISKGSNSIANPPNRIQYTRNIAGFT